MKGTSRSQLALLVLWVVLAVIGINFDNAFSQVVDFESIPGGTPSEGLEVSTQFQSTHGVTFSLENGDSPVLAQVGAPMTAFQGYNLLPDEPAPGTNVGQFFLTDDGVVGGAPSPLVIDYTTEVAAAGGVILDIDREEEWTVEALNNSGNTIGTITLGPNNELDGSATPWSFSFGSPVIKKIRLRCTGYPYTSGLGLAFDNFTPNTPGLECDCPDSDGDGVPDAWDECPNTPEGSAVYSNGCPIDLASPLYMCALEPKITEPGRVIKIYGQGFGDVQGDSVVHIGNKIFDKDSRRIRSWSDCKIKIKVPDYNCGTYKSNDAITVKVWVTLGNEEDSNKKRLKVIRPDDCAYCNDCLWNIRANGNDYFHSNEAWLKPWRTSIDDGWGIFQGGYGYEVEWYWGPYAQNSGSVSGLSWNINSNGRLTVTGSQDHQWHAWTYVYVDTPKALQIPAIKGSSAPRAFLNYAFDTPYEFPATLNLVAGWNRIDITGYNQNDNFNFDLNYNLARNVDRVSSTECAVDDLCICPTVYAPVCGVDGNIYQNTCHAVCAGVDVDYAEECMP